MVPSSCQIAIIGGGPGGLSAALAACRAGVESVVVVERKRCWGTPIQCAGYVPRTLARSFPFDTRAVKSSVDGLDLYLGDERLGSITAPGYVLHRDIFEQQMAEAVVEAGASCLQPAHAVDIGDSTVVVEAKGERTKLKAETIIGADGPRSMTRRHLGLPDPRMAVGLEWELPLGSPLDAAEIHFSPSYGAGYAWVFPYGETAGVGLALDRDHPGDLKELLPSFVGHLVGRGKLKRAEPAATVSGLIPVGGAVNATVIGNMALVGDAAGQTNPLTGAGLMAAVACGEMAGRAAARAVTEDEPSLLREYEEEWRDLLGGFLGRALSGRRALLAASAEDYPEALRQAWRLRRSERRP